MTMKLAIDGGTPVRSAPMPGWPSPTEAEIEAAAAVLRSGRINYWTGTECRAFEAEYARSLGRRHGIALANGTLALELALRAWDVGPGDEVVVPARTFIATASSVVAVGATPVVADVDTDSGNLTADTLAAVLTPRTRAVIPVHLGGWPVEMGPINALAREHGFAVIEDCAQAHGASLDGVAVGALGDVGAFSFCQDKILTLGGEGGLLALDDEERFERAWSFKDHGKSYAKALDPANAPGTTFKWLHDSFGSNYRLTEMQGAIGRVVLGMLPEFSARRRENALRLAEGVRDLPGLRVPLPRDGAVHAFYRLYAYVDANAFAPGWDRDRVLRSVQGEGVPCFYGSCAEIYREQAFSAAGLGPAERLPGAATLHESSLAFQVHPTLAPSDIDDVIEALAKVMEVAAR